MIRHGLGQEVKGTKTHADPLFKLVQDMVRSSKLICPEDAVHREVLQGGGAAGQKGMEILRKRTEGLSFNHGQTIEDSQVFRAVREFINGGQPVDYRTFWKDAFPKKTLRAIFKKRSTVAFSGGIVLLEKVNKRTKKGGTTEDIRLRIRYDFDAYIKERQLQKRSGRHLRDLVRLGLKYRAMVERRSKRYLEGFWAGQKVDRPMAFWNYIGGTPRSIEGLISFLESDIFHFIPTMKIKRDIWRALSEREEAGPARPTETADVGVLSTVLPYTDIMVLGPKMTTVVRDTLDLGRQYDTEIFSIEEGDLVMDALNNIPGED